MGWLLKLCLASPLIQLSCAAASAHHAEMMQLAKTSRASTTHASIRALASFERYANELAEQYRLTGLKCNTTELKEAIATIKSFISDAYVIHLEAHEHDTERAGDCSGKFTECTEDTWSAINLGHAYNLTFLINTSRNLHHQCRLEQKACCMETAASGACGDYDKFRMAAGISHSHFTGARPPLIGPSEDGSYAHASGNGGTTPSTFPSCANPPQPESPFSAEDADDADAAAHLQPLDIAVGTSHTTVGTISHLQPEEIVILNNMEDCLEQVHGWHQPLYHLYKNCSRERDCCNDVENSCGDLQDKLEFRACVGNDYINDHCSLHRTCWTEAIAECDQTNREGYCGQIAQNVEIRKAENETGERIICLLDVLVLDDNTTKRTQLDKCVNNKTYDVSSWDIICDPGAAADYPAVLEPYCFDATLDDPPPVDRWLPCDNGFLPPHNEPAGWIPEEYTKWENSDTWVHTGTHTATGHCSRCPGHISRLVQKRNTSFTINTASLGDEYAVSSGA